MSGPPELEEQPVSTALKVTAVVYLAIVAAAAWAFRDRLSADFWPVDDARVSPNILATVLQILAWTPVFVLLRPPIRRRIHRFVTRHTAPLHEGLDAIKQQAELHHRHAAGVRRAQHADVLASHAELQRRLDHLIEYLPDVPELPST